MFKRALTLFAVFALIMTMAASAGAETVHSAALASVCTETAKGTDVAKANVSIPRGATVKAFAFWEGDRLYNLSNGSYYTGINWKYYGTLRVKVSASWLKISANGLPFAKPNNTAEARTGWVMYRDDKGMVARFQVTQTGRYSIFHFGQFTNPYKCIQMRWTGSKAKMKVNYALFIISNNGFRTMYTKKIYDAGYIATARYTGYPILAGKTITATVLPVKRMGRRYVMGRCVTQIGTVYIDRVGVRISGKVYKAGYNSCYAVIE